MKKIFILLIGFVLGTIAFSQQDSIWIAKYKTVNGVTTYLGSTGLTKPYTHITDSALKVVGTLDASGNLIFTKPKNTLIRGRYAVYSSSGQLLYLVKID